MSRRRLGFDEWCARVRKCADILRRNGTSRQMRAVSFGIERFCYPLICEVAHHPNTPIYKEDYETYYARQLEESRRKYPVRVIEWTNERLLRRKTKPPDVSDARWRMHIWWRKHGR